MSSHTGYLMFRPDPHYYHMVWLALETNNKAKTKEILEEWAKKIVDHLCSFPTFLLLIAEYTSMVALFVSMLMQYHSFCDGRRINQVMTTLVQDFEWFTKVDFRPNRVNLDDLSR